MTQFWDVENSGIFLPAKNWPMGKYIAWIHPENTIYTVSKAGNSCIKWEFLILGPTHKDVVVHKWSVIEGPGVGYTKADLYKLGYKIDTMADLRRAKSDLSNSCVNINIVPSEGIDFKKKVEVESKCSPEEIDLGKFDYLQHMHWK